MRQFESATTLKKLGLLTTRTLACVTVATGLFVAGCGVEDTTGPDDPAEGPTLFLQTTLPNPDGMSGSGFVQFMGMDQPAVTNANAHETIFFAYPFMRGSNLYLLDGMYGDEFHKYAIGDDGSLTEVAEMGLPPGGFSSNLVFASDTKAYISIVYAGKILIVNPQTMTQTGEIDLTTLGIARNPANPDAINPAPAVMVVRDGKLFVGLQQVVTSFINADGVDVAVFDVATDQFEKVIHDPRSAGPGRYGHHTTMFVDEAGDIYVYCVASFGFNPDQSLGFLRIRAGEDEFDPDYFLNTSAMTIDAGTDGKFTLLNGLGYVGNGDVYGFAMVPTLGSTPPNYVTDRASVIVRINLYSQQVETIPVPHSNSMASGVDYLDDGTILLGLSTTTGVGIYTYNPATGEASDGPVISTAGDPTRVWVLRD